MGVAHYLGLDETHHGFFEGALPSYALNTLLAHGREDQSLVLIYCYLRDWFIADAQSGTLSRNWSGRRTRLPY